jgi:dTMP kinase
MFITFEGIDFCGKTTQVELLKNHLVNKDKRVEIIREPGGTEISERIRDILLDKKHLRMFMEAEIFLFSASRAQLVREKIRPYLKKGVYVISDRFHDSTTAYQGFGRGIDINSVEHINKLAIGKTVPDITFIIDVPVKVAEMRKKIKSNMDLDRIEISDSGFYEKVRKGYLKIAESERRFKVIDGTLEINDIHDRIINEVNLLERRSFNDER